MNCPKCGGYMTLDPPQDFYVQETRWRCINCGATRETIASMLQARKRLPRAAPRGQLTINSDQAIRSSRS